MPQATWSLWPMHTPGTPGIVAPAALMPGAVRWHSYQMEGSAYSRCGSLARSGLPVAVCAPETAQLLLPGIVVGSPTTSLNCSFTAAIRSRNSAYAAEETTGSLVGSV